MTFLIKKQLNHVTINPFYHRGKE